MTRIEKGLHEHHARIQAQGLDIASQPSAASRSAPALEAPFAKVNSVVAGSPADSAGLKVGDSITKFGWVDWTNHDKLARVAEAVSQNEGVSCPSRSAGMHIIFAKDQICTTCCCWEGKVGVNMPQIPLIVKVLRPSATGGPSESVQMQLTPRSNWGGRGLLGCHLLPL